MAIGTLMIAAANTADALKGTEDFACRENHSSICRAAWTLTEDTTFAHSLDVISPYLNVAAIVLLGWLASRVLRRLIKRIVISLQGEVAQRRLSSIRRRTPNLLLNTTENVSLRRAQRAETIGAILRSAGTVLIFIISFFTVMQQFAFNLQPFVAGTAIATAALGFGAQNIVRDFLAGFFMVVEDQFGVGDVIDVGTASGTVESVSLRTTRLRDSEGILWHVPNGEIKKVGNKSQQWSRSVVEFRTTLDVEIPHAIRIIKKEADELWKDSAYAGIIIDEPDIWAPEAIDSDGILLKLAVKTRPLEQWQVSRILRSRIKAAFDREGIHIASALANAYREDDEGDSSGPKREK
jgi:small-conductance mechanosensitive channel